MSNQHNNIYNILGKLDALTPKQAAVDTVPAKTINESVEARGSVLAGVARVEARLAQQFAEANDWNNLGAEFRGTKPGTREPTHTGEKEYTKTGVRHHASKRYGGDRADDAETVNSTGEKRGRGRPKKSQFEGDMEEGQLNELSPELLKRARDKAGMKYADADDRRDQKASDKYNRLDDKFNSALRKKQKDEFEVDGKRYPVKENGLQRYTGIKKYGKDGFEALQKAGREGASEEEKGRIKDKYLPEKSVAESINFAEMMKEQHQTVDEYLMELQADIAEFKKSGRMSEKLRDSVEMHKFSKKQLTDAAKQPVPAPAPAPAPKPQGVMGRVGSAIAGGVRSAAGAVNRVVGHPSDAEMLDRLKKDTMKEELDELARLAGLSESLKGGQKKLDKNGKLDSDDFKKLRDKVSEATVDEDMIKSKKDDDKKEDDVEEGAGVMHFKAQQAKADGKDSFKLGDKEYPVKEAKKPDDNKNGIPDYAEDGKGKNDLKKKKVDECGPEMSPFSSMGHAEAESGMSINSSMDTKTGRRTLSVTADGAAAEELAQMLKMAGMGGHSHDEPKAVVIQAGPEEAVEEEREGQYANTPDEEVENIDSIMHQGNDLNREKEQYANKPKAGDNPMATRESIEMPKSLSKMLEAIKMVEAEKCNHTAKGEKCPVHGMKECSYMEEAAKYRDPKYKDKLYTQELPDYMDTREYDNAMWNPKPDDYPGRKELSGGGEFDHNDPLRKGYGRGGTGSMNTHGKRKGLPSRDQVSSLKGSIKAAHGTHPRPNLPEAKPSAGMSKGEKSSLVKKAQAGGDIGKPGKSFDKVAKAAGGGEKGKRIAAAAMWKNAAK